MINVSQFKPKTVYCIYVAATPEKVWQALTDPVFTRQYFFGLATVSTCSSRTPARKSAGVLASS